MSILVSHPTGNRNVRAVINALAGAGLLAEYNTTLSVNPAANWLKLLPAAIRQECLRRSYPLAQEQIWMHPYRELSRLAFPRLGLGHLVQGEQAWASVYGVYKDFDQAVAGRLKRLGRKKGLSAVYAYEDGALATFKQAKALGLRCYYDLPIAYWETARKLMLEEAERLPAWASTLGGGISDSAAKLERKTQELELADVVIVPGQFVRDSLPAWAQGKPVSMAHFGSPKSAEPRQQISSKDKKQPLRVLFVGSMGQRKGLGDLFAAMQLLGRRDIELVVMGSLLAPFEFYKSSFPHFTYETGRPHEQVLALMRSCDVFCLPSIVEGRALVMQEAMSQGLPLIISPNTGGADLVLEGKTGFLIPIRAPYAIAEKLSWCLDNRAAVAEMGRNAQQHAAHYTWSAYGNQVVASLREFQPDMNLYNASSVQITYSS